MSEEMYEAYKATTYQTEDKVKQVVMLYDGIIRYVKQAKAAIEDKRIEDRYNSLTKACEILTGLQLSLDFENGGDVSQTLYDYYAGLDMRLMSLHFSEDISMCELCIKHLKMMREAWSEIDQARDDERNNSNAVQNKTEKNSNGGNILASNSTSYNSAMYMPVQKIAALCMTV